MKGKRKNMPERLLVQKVVIFGQEFVAVQPADGLRLAVETSNLKLRLEHAAAALELGAADQAEELVNDALREIYVAERVTKAPYLAPCPVDWDALAKKYEVADSNGPVMFQG